MPHLRGRCLLVLASASHTLAFLTTSVTGPAQLLKAPLSSTPFQPTAALFSVRGGAVSMSTAGGAVGELTTSPVLPLKSLDSPPPPPLEKSPATLTDHIGLGFQSTVSEAAREGGPWRAIQVALRSMWMVLDFSLIGPLQQLPIGLRILSFYFADKLWGRDEGVLRDVQYGDKAHQKLDIYLPQGRAGSLLNASAPLVLFVHGGSWASGDKWQYALQAKRLRDEGVVVANIRYDLYPSQGFEGMCDDVDAAVEFALSSEGAKYGASADKVLLSAHSAGAHISAMAMLKRAGRMASAAASAEEISSRMPAKLVLASGVFDIPRHYEHEKTRGVHLFSPMHIAAGSTVEAMNNNSPTYMVAPEQVPFLPPTTFLHSKTDTTVPFESSANMCQSLQNAGMRQCKLVDLGDASGHNQFLIDVMLDKDTEGSQLFVRESTRL